MRLEKIYQTAKDSSDYYVFIFKLLELLNELPTVKENADILNKVDINLKSLWENK